MPWTQAVSLGPPGRPTRRRLVLWAAYSLLGLSVFRDALPRATPAAAPANHAPPRAVDAAQPAHTVSLHDALRLLEDARRGYGAVRDYSCVMIKREVLEGALSPEHVIRLSVRTQPLSVDMRWQQPEDLAGQEACYVAGRHNGKMRVRASGILAKLGFMSMNPDDPRVKESSNHSITEAGIGHLIERYALLWLSECALGRMRVEIADYVYDNRPCTRVEATCSERGGAGPDHRTVLFFDHETHLPVRLEVYDWPKDGGGDGELIELYAYLDLRLNVGLGDDVFNH